MKHVLIAAVAAALLLLLCQPAVASGDDAALYREILAQKAPSIVTVKLVLKIKISFMGQGQDTEREFEVPGVVADPSGLVMIAADSLNPGGALSRNEQIDVKTVPTSMKVVFEDDDEEYEAILAAKDTNLNLAFLQIKDLEGKEVSPVSFAKDVDVAVGQELIGVTRYPKGFDYAPYFGTVRVTGRVSQPRPLFAFDGSFDGLGLPVFTRDGVTAGVLATQEGAGGAGSGGGGRLGMLFDMASKNEVFLLPVDTVRATIEQAKKKAAEALKKQSEKEEKKA